MNATDDLTERDWKPGTPRWVNALCAIVQPSKSFLLGAALLRRVWSLLPSEAALAVETTEHFVAGWATSDELLDSWLDAETVMGQGVWSCDDDDDYWSDDPLRYQVQSAISSPSLFPARAAILAIELVRANADPGGEAIAQLREQQTQFLLYRDIVGDAREPTRRSPIHIQRRSTLAQLLSLITRQLRIDPLDMLALADALEEAGCDDSAILGHCRESGPHVRGCWVIERLRRKAAG